MLSPRRRLTLTAAVVLATSPLARGETLTRAPSALAALDLKRQLDEIGGRLSEQRERLVLATVALAGIGNSLNQQAPRSPGVALFATRSAPYVPGSPAAAAAMDAAVRPWIEQREALAALELKAALLADQLQRYKETGVLSPTPAATVKRFKLLIENPWTLPASTPEVAALSLDLIKLQKQLRLYKAEILSAPEKQSPPPTAGTSADRPRFERDAGRGSPENNPIPGLIVLLSSPEPRGRALAADELGNAGAAAAPAVPALRRALTDPDRRVRASAAAALGSIGDAGLSVAADLRRALRDPDEEVRLSARAALRRLEH